MLKVGVQTKGILPEREVWEGFRMIHDAGFEKIDFNLDTFLQNTDIYAGKLNSFFDNDVEDLARYFLPYLEAMKYFGITPSQMHAPYPVCVYGRGKQNEYMESVVIPKSILLAEFLGVPYVIVHPFKLQYHVGIEEEKRQNVEYFQMLIPLLKQCHVKVCFENLYEGVGMHITEGVCADPEDAVWYIDTLNAHAGEELFGFCLDTGHLQLTKRDPYSFIKRLGHRLKCLHLHENDAWADLHQMPYTFGENKDSGLDWDGILRGLKEIGFEGTLSFETFPCVNSFPKPMTETVLKTICGIGRSFAERIGEPETEQSRTPLRLGIIGTGRIAKRFVSALSSVENVQLTCVYNPNLQSAEAFAQTSGNPACTDQWDSFLEEIDAAYIASPHETHGDYAAGLLEAGKHVLCEKPMSFQKKEAEELYRMAEKQHCVLREAVKTAYCPGFLAMMDMAKSGKIGQIKDVEACFSKLTPTNLRELTDVKYGGSVTELGSYVLLPIWKLLGTDYTDLTYQSVYAANGVDTYTKLLFTYEDGMATAKTGLGVKSEGQLVISGTKGYILCESPWWLTRKFEVRYEDSNKREVYEYPYEESGLQYELEAFLDEIGMLQTCNSVTDGIRDENLKDAADVVSAAGLTPEESMANARVMEFYLRQQGKRRPEPDRQKEQNVRIWAHRGCSMQYPENTLPAFHAAAELPQVTGIELDVQLTRDGQVVVFHDENVSRVTTGCQNVADYTLEELKNLEFKQWEELSEKAEKITVPTLEEVFVLLKPYCQNNGLKINIEFKTSVIRYEGIEEKTLVLVKKYGLEPYIVYSSFWAESVKLIKELDPQAKTGMLAGNLSDCIKWGRYAGVDALHPWIGGMDCKIPEDMKDMPVRAWNGEEPFYRDGRVLKERNLRKYAMFGVTDVFTNVPENYE